MTHNHLFQPDQLHFVMQNNAVETALTEDISQEILRQIIFKSLETVQLHYEADYETAEITLRIVDTEEGQQLNRQYRQKDYATNVLTFEYGVDKMATLRADIVICLTVLQREAKEQQKRLDDHFKHLLVHGVLHALGFDHETEEEADTMEALEIEILAQFQINNPYISCT